MIRREQVINMDCPDDTPLNLAIKSNDLEKVRLLLRKRGGVHFKDEKGLTTLHIVVQQRLDMLAGLCEQSQIPGNIQLEKNEQIANLLLENNSTNYNSTGLTNFHVACTLNNTSTVESLLDQVLEIDESVDESSPLWPGYTGLHFAALCNIKTVKLLISKGANLLSQDAKGVTPLNLCTRSFSIKDVHSVLTCVTTWKDILFSDKKSKLMDYVYSLQDSDHLKEFLQNTSNISRLSLPNDSPLWPGCTILHVAVILLPESSLQLVNDILATRTAVVAVNNRNSTPIHLAFRHGKMQFAKLLVAHHKRMDNPLDSDDLSHLHIAVVVNNLTVVKKLLNAKTNVDVAYKGQPLPMIKPSWTPLHVAVAAGNSDAVIELLDRGANLLCKDSRGFTALHMLIGSDASTDRIAERLLADKGLKECTVEGLGLTHLHVAVWKNDVKAIGRLIKAGADLEATIGNGEFAGCRPIHLATMGRSRFNAFRVLVQRGADVLARRPDGESALSEVLSVVYDSRFVGTIVDLMRSDKRLQRRVGRELGLRPIHLACHALDADEVHRLLRGHHNVGPRVREDSNVWPGFTPLHLLLAAELGPRPHVPWVVASLVDLLLERGADVTARDADGETPVLFALKALYMSEDVLGIFYAEILLKRQLDYSINPVNKAGISHFHVACLTKDLNAVEKFLEHADNVDINQRASSISCTKFAGYTPLLMALSRYGFKSYSAELYCQLVGLLLEHGADVHAASDSGWTPLHKLANCPSQTRGPLLHKILIGGTDTNKRTSEGITPLELLLRDGASSDELKYFVDRGGRINSYNPISDVGYMSIVLSSVKYNRSGQVDTILHMMMDSPDITAIDDTGRGAFHNAVTSESTAGMLKLFDKLVALGCDIRQRDNRGRTALHLAFKFHNKEAVWAFLMCGVDINDVEATGTPASLDDLQMFDEAWWNQNRKLLEFFTIFLKKCQQLGIQMNQLSAFLEKCRVSVMDARFDKASFERQVEETKNLKIGDRGLTVHDLLYETKMSNIYSLLSPMEHNALQAFMFFNDRGFEEVKELIKFQCRKAMDRSHLVAPAAVSLKTLLGFPLPDLCVDIIFKSLSNSDLRNLNKAVV